MQESPPDGTATASLAADTIYNTLTFLLRAICVPIALGLAARSLGVEGQGAFGFVQAAVAVLIQISLWGLPTTVTRFVARARGLGSREDLVLTVRTTGRWLTRGLLLLCALAALLSWRFGGELRAPLLAGILQTLASAYVFWRLALCIGLRRYDIQWRSYLLQYLVLFPLLWLGLRSSTPIFGAVLAFAVARCAQAGLLLSWTRGLLRSMPSPPPGPPLAAGRTKFQPLNTEMLLSYGLSMAGVSLCSVVLWERSEVAFLKLWGDYRMLGIYTAAVGLAILVYRIPQVLSVVLMPVIAGFDGDANRAVRRGEVFRRGARLLTLVLGPMMAVLIGASPAVISVIFGSEFAESSILMAVVLLPLLLSGMGNAARRTLAAAGDERKLLRATALMAVVNLLLDVALIRYWGVFGAAVACALAQLFYFTLLCRLAQRLYPSPPGAASSRWLQQSVIIAISLVTAAGLGLHLVASEVPAWLALLVQSGAAAAAWLCLAVLLRPLTAEDGLSLEQAIPEGMRPRLAPLVRRLTVSC